MGYCLLIGIAHTIDLEVGLFTAIVRAMDFGYCPLIGIARTSDLEGGRRSGIVRTFY